MNLREPISAALSASLDSELEREKPVDRLAAFSKASRLGTLLWRLKFNNDASCYKPAIYLLAKKLAEKRGKNKFIQKIAECALREWLDDKCNTCNGAGSMMVDNLKIICTTCEGTGARRASDKERAKALGLTVEQARKYAKIISDALFIITAHDLDTNHITAEQLERI